MCARRSSPCCASTAMRRRACRSAPSAPPTSRPKGSTPRCTRAASACASAPPPVPTRRARSTTRSLSGLLPIRTSSTPTCWCASAARSKSAPSACSGSAAPRTRPATRGGRWVTARSSRPAPSPALPRRSCSVIATTRAAAWRRWPSACEDGWSCSWPGGCHERGGRDSAAGRSRRRVGQAPRRISRAITMRWISLVPSPISISLTSRCMRSTGTSRQ